MYGQTGDQEKQKKKIVIAALIMGIIIIVLIGVLINAITSKNKNKVANADETTAVIREDEKSTNVTKVEENSKAEEEKPEDAKLDPVSNEKTEESTATVTPSSDVKSETVATTTTTTSGSNLPSTGPAGALGLAILAGSATTYALYRKKNLA